MTAVTWADGEFPVWTNISGTETGWALPPEDKDVGGSGPFIDEGDALDFAPGSTLPAHLTHWRFPDPSSYAVSPAGGDHPGTLRLRPSALNLTALDGSSAAAPGRQTFVGRRQQATLFTYRATLAAYRPRAAGEEAGVTVFLTQNHHLDLAVALLPARDSTTTITTATNASSAAPRDDGAAEDALIPQIRFRGISTGAAAAVVPAPVIAPVPEAWLGRPLVFEIKAANGTHFSFSAGPADAESLMQTVVYVSNAAVSYGFTGEYLPTYPFSPQDSFPWQRQGTDVH